MLLRLASQALTCGTALLKLLHVLGQKEVIGIKPKFHMLAHMIYNLECEAGCPMVNPWMGCTWRDEDFVGKMMRMVRSVHSRAVGHRVVEHYLARMKALL